MLNCIRFLVWANEWCVCARAHAPNILKKLKFFSHSLFFFLLPLLLIHSPHSVSMFICNKWMKMIGRRKKRKQVKLKKISVHSYACFHESRECSKCVAINTHVMMCGCPCFRIWVSVCVCATVRALNLNYLKWLINRLHHISVAI